VNGNGQKSVLIASLLLLCSAPPLAGEGTAPAIGARAEKILRSMSDYLKSVEQFTFRADIAYDALLVGGQKVRYGGVGEISVHRPDYLRVEHRGDERNMRVVFNGVLFTFHDLDADLYAQRELTANIDTAVDGMFEKFGFSVPTADLVYSDPYATLTSSVESGSHLGLHTVDGVRCHHLAFTQESIDWQIWIEDGPRPLPRQLVITYKDEPASPQYAVQFSRWNLSPGISDSYFEFEPPAGARPMEFLPPEEDEAER